MATETTLRQTDTEPLETALPEDRIEAKNLSFIVLLIVLAERKRTIAGIAVCFAVLAGILAFVIPVRYTASVTVLPPQQSTSIGSAVASQLGNLGGAAMLASSGLGIKNPNDMYLEMMKGRTVEEAMVRDFGLMQEYHDRRMSDARKDFERHVALDGSGKDGLIHISVFDHDPTRAAALANGYVDRFRDLTSHLAIGEASQRRLFFEQQLQQTKDNLANAEEALKSTEQTTGMIQLDSQARALIESAANLRAQVAAKEVQIQAMRAYASDQNSQLIEAEQELQGLRAQLTKLGGSASGDGELIMPKGLVPEAGLEYERKLRDVKYNEAIFDILARQFEVAKIDEARQGSIVQVVDAAAPPDKKSFPPRTLMVIGGLFLGLIVGCAYALICEAFGFLESQPLAGARLRQLRGALAWNTWSSR